MKIGGRKIKIREFDTVDIIISRYILIESKHTEYVMSKYVRVELVDPLSQKDIHSTLLPAILKGVDYEDIYDIYTPEFSNIDAREVKLLWALVNNVDVDELTELDGLTFSQRARTRIDLKEFSNTIVNANKKLADDLKLFDARATALGKVPPITHSELSIESIVTRFILVKEFIPQELFDNVIVDAENPICRLGGTYENSLYRVYEGINGDAIFPIKDGFVPPPNTVLFSILGYEATAHGKYIDILHPSGGPELVQNIIDALEENGIVLETHTQVSVRSTATATVASFNKAIFADLITTDEVVSHFMYVTEHNIPVVEKEKFTIRIVPKGYRPIGATFVPSLTISPGGEGVMLRFVNNSSLYESRRIMRTIARVFTLYESDSTNDILELYSTLVTKTLLNSYQFKYSKAGGKSAGDKDGKRLVQLKRSYPYTFRHGYAQVCQPQRRQPFIVKPENVKSYIKRYGDNKLLKYKDEGTGDIVSYACEPREPGEENTHTFIGLRQNTSKSQKYKNEVPYVPCCFLKDRYSKRTSVINTGIDTVVEENYAKEGREPIMGYLLHPEKSVPRGRFGIIPEYIERLADIAGYENSKKVFYRSGVMQRQDSVLHVMLRAFEPEYIFMNKDTRLDAVRALRRRLSKQSFIPIAQQTTYLRDVDIRKILRDGAAYVDPNIFLRLLEVVYECNIYLFTIDKLHSRGEISQLYSEGALLPTTANTYERSIVIVKNNVYGETFPYQCSLLVKKLRRSMKFVTYFEDEALIPELAKVTARHLEVRVLTPTSFKTVTATSISVLGSPKAQYIDVRGKTRALFYKNDVCMFIPPMAPFDLKVVDDVSECTVKAAKSLARRLGLRLLTQEIQDGKVVGLWFEQERRRISQLHYAYIPVLATQPLENVAVSSPMLHDPLRVNGRSKLAEYRDGRKVAGLLVKWSYELYLSDPDSFGEDSFEVNTSLSEFSHYYELYISSSTSDKVHVPSVEVMRRLRMRVRVAILNGTIHDKMDFRRYDDPEDYTYQNHTIILKGIKGLEMFVIQKGMYRQRWEITTTDNPTTTLPYILHTPLISRNPVIVQNVRDGDCKRTATVIKRWVRDKVNAGYNAPPDIRGGAKLCKKYSSVYLEDSKKVYYPKDTPKIIDYYDDIDGHGAILELKR